MGVVGDFLRISLVPRHLGGVDAVENVGTGLSAHDSSGARRAHIAGPRRGLSTADLRRQRMRGARIDPEARE